MKTLKNLMKESELDLSTLVVFTKAEHAIHKKEYQTIKDSGLTPTQFGVLEALYSKGDLKINELIEKILTTSGNITVVVKNLEKEGFIHRKVDPRDKRSCIISITDKGSQCIEGILPKHVSNIRDIFKVLSDEEKLILKTILKKFKAL
ncbi:MAG: MarR family transcriptional regulator [Clostridiales bacterium]|nr:MarR family transcriptional regulator [uncultured Anaerosporobacter sp.]MBS5932790.1 MarR family transcriptional regulator [Clostridiales bacterium]